MKVEASLNTNTAVTEIDHVTIAGPCSLWQSEMNTELEEELEVIRSIYEASKISLQSSDNIHEIIYEELENNVKIEFKLPLKYPLERPVSITIYQNHKRNISGEQSSHEICDNSPGEVVLFQVIENVRSNYRGEKNDFEESSVFTGALIDHEEVTNTMRLEEFNHLVVVNGPVTMEQKSSFQSHIAAVQSMKEVTAFRAIVLSDKKVSF